MNTSVKELIVLSTLLAIFFAGAKIVYGASSLEELQTMLDRKDTYKQELMDYITQHDMLLFTECSAVYTAMFPNCETGYSYLNQSDLENWDTEKLEQAVADHIEACKASDQRIIVTGFCGLTSTGAYDKLAKINASNQITQETLSNFGAELEEAGLCYGDLRKGIEDLGGMFQDNLYCKVIGVKNQN
jgi:hypothetical protein